MTTPEFTTNHKHRYLSKSTLLRKLDDSIPLDSFEPSHLASIAIHFSRLHSPQLSARQKLTLEQFMPLFTLKSYDKEITSINYPSILVESFFPLFDGLFFFNTLQGSGRVKIYLSAQESEIVGLNGVAKQIISRGARRYEIVIYSQRQAQGERPSMALTKMIGTLLHEMTHVFMQLYACKACTAVNSWESLGTTGHGVAWLDIMSALKVACASPRLLGVDLGDCGLEGGLATELRGCGKGVPGDEVLNGWSLRRCDVEKHLEYLRKRKRKELTVFERVGMRIEGCWSSTKEFLRK